MTTNIDNGFISDQNGKACTRYREKEQILTAMLAAESKNITPINKAINEIEISPLKADNDFYLDGYRGYYWFNVLESRPSKIDSHLRPLSCGTLCVDFTDPSYKDCHGFQLFLLPTADNVLRENYQLLPLHAEIANLMGFLHSRFMFEDFFQYFARLTATSKFMDLNVVEKQWQCEC